MYTMSLEGIEMEDVDPNDKELLTATFKKRQETYNERIKLFFDNY
jgi:hypothetical protein